MDMRVLMNMKGVDGHEGRWVSGLSEVMEHCSLGCLEECVRIETKWSDNPRQSFHPQPHPCPEALR